MKRWAGRGRRSSREYWSRLGCCSLAREGTYVRPEAEKELLMGGQADEAPNA